MSNCSHCQLKAKRLSGKVKRKIIMVNKNENVLNWTKDFLSTPIAKQMLKKRKVYPETIFANAKSFHRLGKAKFKGRWKVEFNF
jgi:hypothetical protein